MQIENVAQTVGDTPELQQWHGVSEGRVVELRRREGTFRVQVGRRGQVRDDFLTCPPVTLFETAVRSAPLTWEQVESLVASVTVPEWWR